jgi:putative transcriptional regulator
MSSLFDDLCEGLQQAIDYEKGVGEAKKVTYVITPITKYESDDIKSVRKKAGMTQAIFADYLGVSVKTVEAWERGRTHPTGPACRLIALLSESAENDDMNLSFIKEVQSV